MSSEPYSSCYIFPSPFCPTASEQLILGSTDDLIV